MSVALLLILLIHSNALIISAESLPSTYFAWPFDDGNVAGWTPVVGWNSEAGRPEYPQACEIVNGEYSLTTCEPLYRLHSFSDFAFEAQARLVQAAREPIWGIAFRVNPAAPIYSSIVEITGDPYTFAQGYFLEFVGSTLYLFRCTESCSVLGSTPSPIDPFVSHTLKVVALGSNIRGFVNDLLVFEVRDSVFSEGLVGLFSIPNGCDASGCQAVTTNFDNVRIVPEKIVPIDVGSGKGPNVITENANRSVSVSILSDATFDATQIDPSTVTFGNLKITRGTEPVRWELLDLTRKDGMLDLRLWFLSQDTGITAGDTVACLIGKTYSGLQVFGCDSIRAK